MTGLGLVTPVGNTVEESWAGLLAGRCGIRDLTLFDGTGCRSQQVAEVGPFAPAKP